MLRILILCETVKRNVKINKGKNIIATNGTEAVKTNWCCTEFVFEHF